MNYNYEPDNEIDDEGMRIIEQKSAQYNFSQSNFTENLFQGMFTIESHAQLYADGAYDISFLVGNVLVYYPVHCINTYINKHKDGWVGVEGEFARILAKVVAVLQ
jgi:hypothetical protein